MAFFVGWVSVEGDPICRSVSPSVSLFYCGSLLSPTDDSCLAFHLGVFIFDFVSSSVFELQFPPTSHAISK